jgi:hypothetical protein
MISNKKGLGKTWTQQKNEQKTNKRQKKIDELIEEWNLFITKLKERNKKAPIPLNYVFINVCHRYGITLRTLQKIIKSKTENLWPEHLFKSPYEFVLKEPSLITYKRAESIELGIGLMVDIETKIEAWINYIFTDSSHLSKYDIDKKLKDENFPEETKKKIWQKLIKSKIKFKNKIWMYKKQKFFIPNWGEGSYFYTSEKIKNREKNIEDIIRELSVKRTDYNLDDSEIKEKYNIHINGKFKLAKEQKQFIKLFFGLSKKRGGKGPNICGLTGGPGTGKSFTLGKIIDIEKEINPESRILGAALAGMAVNALLKSTDNKITCQTLHKSIIFGHGQIKNKRIKSYQIAKELNCSYQDVYHYYKQEDEWPKYREDVGNDDAANWEKIEKELNFYYDLVFIDETTMVNIFILREILIKLIDGNPNIRIIFVGDINQLPSIGPGQFFTDILNNNRELNFKACQLTKIHRQKNEKLKKTIKSLLDKNSPIPKNHDGFKYIKFNDETYGTDIINILNKYRKEKVEEDKKFENNETWCNYVMLYFQFLSPQNCGKSGVKDINTKIQRYLINLGLNMKWLCEYDDQSYYIGDKIINTRNDYDNEPSVYNGQIGIILFIKDDKIIVQFNDSEEVYEYENINDLKYNSKPAHCVTIHKSQGSGFKNVILFINEHSTMWPTNGKPLLYTGASRAEENLWIIGCKDTIKKAKNSPNNTFTTLFRHDEYY